MSTWLVVNCILVAKQTSNIFCAHSTLAVVVLDASVVTRLFYNFSWHCFSVLRPSVTKPGRLSSLHVTPPHSLWTLSLATEHRKVCTSLFAHGTVSLTFRFLICENIKFYKQRILKMVVLLQSEGLALIFCQNSYSISAPLCVYVTFWSPPCLLGTSAVQGPKCWWLVC